MSTKIAFFHNLPNGGGMRMFEKIIERYKDQYEIDLYVIGETSPSKIKGINTIFIKAKPWKTFILRNIWIFFILPQIHKKISDQINKKYNFIFLTHDYFTKSPYLLRYLKIYSVYLCQEPQREYYESFLLHSPLLKDKIANAVRYPIKIIDVKNVSYAKKIISNSKFSKNIIDKIYDKKSEIVYPGVDTYIFKPSKKNKTNNILCVGGINRIKNQLFLVESLELLLKEYKLILVGSGRKEYINKVIKRDRNTIEIVDKITDKELAEYYSTAKVTCITAYGEPFGLSSIESQACGTPVVAIKEGGPTETISNGITGYLCDRNKDEFLLKTIKAIKNSKTMGIKSRKQIMKKWRWEKTLIPLDKYFPK